jgi:hypothetical protein
MGITMIDRPDNDLSVPESNAERDELLDRLFGEYVDRLNAGERIDISTILRDHPDVGLELIDQLEQFQNAAASGYKVDSPLGTLGGYTLRRQIGRGGMGVKCEVRRYVK